MPERSEHWLADYWPFFYKGVWLVVALLIWFGVIAVRPSLAAAAVGTLALTLVLGEALTAMGIRRIHDREAEAAKRIAELEETRRKQEEVIRGLQAQVSSLTGQIDSLDKQIDSLHQQLVQLQPADLDKLRDTMKSFMGLIAKPARGGG
jgi:uncharacterized coiled-coil protein SlyX